jgi:hypothetical protein
MCEPCKPDRRMRRWPYLRLTTRQREAITLASARDVSVAGPSQRSEHMRPAVPKGDSPGHCWAKRYVARRRRLLPLGAIMCA